MSIRQWKRRMEATDPESQFHCDIIGLALGKCHYMVPDIEGRPGGFYCGAETEDALSSWCLYHARFIYQGNPFNQQQVQEAA